MHDCTKEIIKLSPNKQALFDLLLRKKGVEISRAQIIAQKRDSNIFPLSFAQQRLWLFDQLEPNSHAYNISLAIRFSGPLDISALDESLNEIVRRHESLRTTFTIVNGEPMQVIAANLRLYLSTLNLSSFPRSEWESEVQKTLTRESRFPFDLTQGPLLRAKLLKLAQKEHILVLVIHHIISDGWSIGLLFRELTFHYEAYSHSKPSQLPKPSIQYADFAVWQRQWLTGAVLESQLNYWKRQLGRQLSILKLPTDHPRPPIQTYEGAKLNLKLSQSLTERIEALSKHEGVSLFMTLLSTFKILLYRLTGQDDIAIGSPIANRNRKEIEEVFGFFVNTLVLRTNLSGNPTFRELLGRVRNVALGAYAHQDLPFEKLVEELQPERDLSRSPLFQVFFNMHNFERLQYKLHELKIVEDFQLTKPNSKFDLIMQVNKHNQQIRLAMVYNTDLFENDTVAFMLGHFKTLLENIVANPGRRISKFRLLNSAKRQQCHPRSNLVYSTDSFIEFKREDIEQSISERFEQQVEKYPKNIAVKTKDDEWSYDELNKTANRMAKKILALCGSGQDRIGLLFEHGAQMIAGIFAVLKAGKTYVPLDPSFPVKRISYMLGDSQIIAILTNNTNLVLAESLSNNKLQILNIDNIEPSTFANNINLSISPDSVAYILYTSGSTGQPKGVMQTHRNVLHHIRNYVNNLRISNYDRLTLLSNYSFDAAMMDIMGGLLSGACLCPIDIKERSLIHLSEWLNKEKITIYHSTPTFYRYLVNTLSKEDNFPNIRLVVLGGEEVYKKDFDTYKKHFSTDCTFVNTYGPTESTIALQYFLSNQMKIIRNTVPIGYPVEDTEILLLDKNGEVAEIYGEIAIKSDYVSIGYCQETKKQHKVFKSDPDGGNKRIYRTGDMGRLLPDGSIEFRGRKDLQVKIRGFRVELKEIESELISHEAIKECVVAASDDGRGSRELTAYIVCSESPSSLSLRSYLRDALPDYMIPSRFIQLDTIPLINNGKADYATLSSVGNSQALLRSGYVQPMRVVEKKIAKIWQDVLGVDKISLHDNFFDLGGHSIMAIKVISLIEKDLKIYVPFKEFFNQTLGQFAASCEEKLLSNKKEYATKHC